MKSSFRNQLDDHVMSRAEQISNELVNSPKGMENVIAALANAYIDGIAMGQTLAIKKVGDDR